MKLALHRTLPRTTLHALCDREKGVTVVTAKRGLNTYLAFDLIDIDDTSHVKAVTGTSL